MLAEFKAEIINNFVKTRNIATIIEFGCGDGNQLTYAEYPSYIGFDVSPQAVKRCRKLFRGDKTKKFGLVEKYRGQQAQLTLSLDVIFHLIEDDVFNSYRTRLFDSSEQFVIIYSSNFDEKQKFHERPRQFTRWIEINAANWKLIQHIPNRFPYKGDNTQGSPSDFYIYEKI